ncbi:MAG TPA: PAS domain S-box protein [Candidatus Acidoferrum sp.]|nr:PAS domain S-box protein [Candidatus Acidoferrum sp.]
MNEQHEHYRIIFASAHIGIVTTDLAGNFLDANPAFCDMLGYSVEEIRGTNNVALTHPEDQIVTRQARADVAAGVEGSGILEKRFLHKAGHYLWVRLIGSAVHDADGRVVSLFAMVEDITDRKQTEAELSRMQDEIAISEQRLDYITRATLDLIWDWDVATGKLWWGDGLQSLFGFTADMMGDDEKFWLRRAHPDDRRRMVDTFHGVLNGKSDGWDLNFRIMKLDGHYLTVRERAFAVRDAAGRTERIVGGVSDVSAQLELEERLRQSQRLESLGQLTGGVAHDFNNLLTVILGNAELLREELYSSPALQELADAISRSALQGADLTHRLLAFARKQALEPKNVNLNQLVENMGKILARTLGEEIRFQLCLPPRLWLCEVDPNQLEAAILNLCLNARDAMPDGGELMLETLNVTLDADYAERHAEVKSGDYVCLAISDTGVGIAPEHMDKVLEPFFTTKPKGKGTGLGLSTIFGFIKQSQGHLSLYSEPGHGTTVRIYLPRLVAGVADNLQSGGREASPHRGHEAILLVEDDAMVRQYAEAQLRSLGYRVLSAANGQQALAVLQEHAEIDLLFTDVIMPGGMGGRQLAEAARQLRPGLKVLYTSGYTENSIVHNGRLDPGVHLLGKPYQRLELARKLRELLDAR